MEAPPITHSMVLAHRKARFDYFGSTRFAGLLIVGLLIAGGIIYVMESAPIATPEGGQNNQAAAATVGFPEQAPFNDIDIVAKAVYVKDLATGRVLYEKNPDAQLPLASITKIPMAIAVSEVLAPFAAIKIPRDTSPPGSLEHLGAGEIWTVKDIMNFTLVASSNNGADILAGAADPLIHSKYPQSPAEGATIWRMNDLAADLGLHNTYFINDNGLDESATQAGSYGSARDMAVLFSYAYEKWPSTFAATARGDMQLASIHGTQTRALNTNEALGSIPGLIMGKTGYTDLAGGNLGIIFNVGLSHPIVAIVLDSTFDGRFTDMRNIIDASYRAVLLE